MDCQLQYDADVARTVPLATSISRELAKAGTPERAAKEKAYLKSQLKHLGVPVPLIRSTVRGALRGAGALERTQLLAAVEALWTPKVHELRVAAVELLHERAALLQAHDLALVERLIRESRTWALVDELAARVAGALVEREQKLARRLDRWAKDNDFWVRRAAMLALLLPLRRGEGDFERFGRYAEAMLEEREFFIRKAIGWVLRETSKRRPELVYRWLSARAGRASGVTMREATKYLAPAQRKRLAAAAART
jgi:3-methyladenine DNA glycosylase AlkD